MSKKTSLQMGQEGEAAFASWLNKNEMGYVEIKQNQDDLACVFKEKVKRPDFLVLIPNMGLIAVDVKNHRLKDNAFTLNIPKEIAKAVEFESQFRLYLWYAYKDYTAMGTTWYFISAAEAIHKGKHLRNSGNEDYLKIDLSNFTRVKTAAEMGKLFDARIGGVGFLARAIESYFKSAKLK